MLECVRGIVAGYVLFALSCGLVCIDSTCVIPCALHAMPRPFVGMHPCNLGRVVRRWTARTTRTVRTRPVVP